MRSIRKQYPGVLALDNVGFELQAGEVHCLVGENGAGKSTLIKILSGAIQKDSGEIFVNGNQVELHSPHDAQRLGIGIIHQDFKLVPELSVAENILLGNEPINAGSPFIDFKAMHELVRRIISQLGEEIDMHTAVKSLSAAKKQIVEIAKALSKKVSILAMDEPSAALTGRELNNLFTIIRRLKSEGVGIIYISHRLEEIFDIGDRVTVLRDGSNITTSLVSKADRRSLIQWMVGRELEQEFPLRGRRPKLELQQSEEILRVENINGGIVRDVSLTLHRGEILGIAGLVGAGRSELARIIFGADKKESGKIFLDGKEIAPRSPREAIDLGIGLLTEDRNKYGLIMQMCVRENITLSNLRDVTKGLFINKKKEVKMSEQFVSDLKIKTPGIEQEVEHLSGGNRQKVVLARWLYAKSKVMMFDEPTAGIDVGAKYEIYNLINQLAKDGIGIIMISSELPELLGICGRIAVMCEGHVTGILSRSEATQEKIMMLATGETIEISSGS